MNMQTDPVSTLTLEQRAMVEGVAAQLYEQDCADKERAGQSWGVVDDHVKKRWRSEALRKLRTGQLDGWYKVDPVARHRKENLSRRVCELG